jgi:hypothetical protein
MGRGKGHSRGRKRGGNRQHKSRNSLLHNHLSKQPIILIARHRFVFFRPPSATMKRHHRL